MKEKPRFKVVELSYTTKIVNRADPTQIRKYTYKKAISYHNTEQGAIKKTLKLRHLYHESRELDSLMCGGDSEVMSLIDKADFYVVDRKTKKWYYVGWDGYDISTAQLRETEQPVMNVWDL